MIAILNTHSLTVRNRFMPEKQKLSLSERKGTTTITVGPEAPAINVGDWLKDESGPGAGIIYRVKSIEQAYETQTRTINCEHIITTLKDTIMFGKILPGNITGNLRATNCTVVQACKFIMGYQSDWVMNGIGYNQTEEFNFNGDNLLSALETVSSALEDPWWSYDLTVYPFRLNIKPRSTGVACEMRMDRNLKTIKRTVDRSRMFTRFYPIGKNDIHIPGDYVDRNTGTYGVVCKVEVDSSKESAEALTAWARSELHRHAQPEVTITISGLELSSATGEPLDRLTLGTKCRVALPEYSTTIEEWITKLEWSDKIADPESVTVTLANTLADVASIVNSMQQKSGGGGGGRRDATQDGEDHAWFVDTDDHVAMVAEAVAGEGAATNWSRVAEVVVDGQGIHQRVTKTENDIVVANAAIDVNENRIKQEVTRAKNSETTLNGKIVVEAGKISQIVSAVGKNGRVTAASITTSINESGSSCFIYANKIYMIGETIANKITANYINSKVGEIPILGCNAVSAKNVTVSSGLTCSGRLTANTVGAMTMELGGVSFTNFIKSASVSGNTLTLTPLTGSAVTFSKATTLSGSWSGGTFLVSASPQGNTVQTTITGGTAYRDGSILCIPINSDLGSTGKEVYASLTSRSSCVSGISYYGGSITLYYKSGTDEYRSAGTHYWYYKNSASTPTTWYTFG